VQVAVVPGPGKCGLLRELGPDGSAAGPVVEASDLAEAVRDYERKSEPRWVWPTAAVVYQRLLPAGVRVARCHDVALVDALISGRDAAIDRSGGGPGRPGPSGGGRDASPARLEEARALLRTVEAGQRPDKQIDQPALFDPVEAGVSSQVDPRSVLDALIDIYADQLRSIEADEHPGKFGLLVTAESAGSLVAAEMTMAGLPWRPEVHDALLTEMLGPRPTLPGQRPGRLAELADQVAAAFGNVRGRRPGVRQVNPDSPSQLLQALAAEGIRLTSTRLAVLRDVDHPAIAPLLEYKELSRLHSAFGWNWLDMWVNGGRFRPEYVVGGVVSGRWASRGGGALQIPRMLRRAVVADPGWVLVVADASQLEPRVLAALAGDRAFADAAMGGDLYAELATAFSGERAKAKVAMLSAMYGGAGGEAGQLLAVLRQRFPAAAGYVEAAARAGEEGRVVRSVLGRTCPPPSADWRALTEDPADPDAERDPRAGRASRARGRFTRNFVIQASAADWALVMLVSVRAELAKIMTGDGATNASSPAPSASVAARPVRPELVFFQHDEVIVHCPRDQADAVAAAVSRAASVASRMVFGPTRVAFPLSTAVVDCYADAK
jgi:DNA polymerase-1